MPENKVRSIVVEILEDPPVTMHFKSKVQIRRNAHTHIYIPPQSPLSEACTRRCHLYNNHDMLSAILNYG